MNQIALLWAAGLCTISLVVCASGLGLHQAREARQRVFNRMDRIAAPYRPTSVQERPSDRKFGMRRLSLASRIERLFGFEREKRSKNAYPFGRVLFITAIISGLAGFMATKGLGQVGALAGLPLWVLLTRLFYGHSEKKHAKTLFRQFPDALSMIVRSVRVGVPLNSAVRMVSEEALNPTAAEFRQLLEEISIGQSIGDALRAMSDRNNLAEYRFFATALSLQSQTGGGLAETLETLADTIRKRVAAQLRGHALASEARTSCYVLGALPFVVGLLLTISNPSYMSVLFTTSAGLKLLAAAVLSLSVGMYVMHAITKATLQ